MKRIVLLGLSTDKDLLPGLHMLFLRISSEKTTLLYGHCGTFLLFARSELMENPWMLLAPRSFCNRYFMILLVWLFKVIVPPILKRNQIWSATIWTTCGACQLSPFQTFYALPLLLPTKLFIQVNISRSIKHYNSQKLYDLTPPLKKKCLF